MMRARRIAGVFAAAWLGAWAGRIAVELLDPSRPLMIACFAIGTLGGAVVGWFQGRKLEPWSPQQARDAVTGWGFVIGVACVLPTLLLPAEGRVVGAVTVGILALVGTLRLRRWADAEARRDQAA